jgi:YggT family protein
MEFITFFFINVIRILKYAILVRVLLSWVSTGNPGRFTQLIHDATEPVLGIFRKIIPNMGMIDISPILAFFVLDFAQIGILNLFNSI